ncbi:MAG: SPFH domain-containing protein, partial [Clostridia bacterium]|nr:SPFH domain-containing protein [Clostridia bacterium]
MGKFVIPCPDCGSYVEARTGLFASRKIRCSCGSMIHVQSERMASRMCPSCGNMVVYDQANTRNAKCPVCRAQLIPPGSLDLLFRFPCRSCGCELTVLKTDRTVTCPVCDAANDVQTGLKLENIRSSGKTAVISFDGDNRSLVWKHPLTDVSAGSQLIVHESQEAIFFRDGEALDSFPAGRYTLDVDTLPEMNRRIQLPPPGMPFHSEIYFVNLATQMNIKWGTDRKASVLDPKSGMSVELGASGTYNLRVVDPRKLVIRLVGTGDGLVHSNDPEDDEAP